MGYLVNGGESQSRNKQGDDLTGGRTCKKGEADGSQAVIEHRSYHADQGDEQALRPAGQAGGVRPREESPQQPCHCLAQDLGRQQYGERKPRADGIGR